MILKSRLYDREEPSKDAKLIIIYCEGKKREDQYFNYFSGISTRIRLEIEPPKHHDDTSPMGLYTRAINHTLQSRENQNPKYELIDDDEIWFVIDTDDWGDKIDELRTNCNKHMNWLVTQSNPCFEVWLYYHFFKFETFDGMDVSKNWKTFLDTKKSGGFDSRKHPVYIKDAIENSKVKFEETGIITEIGCTEVFKLAESIFPLVEEKIDKALHKIENI